MTMVGIAIANLIMLSRYAPIQRILPCMTLTAFVSVEVLWRDSKYHWHVTGGLFALWTVFVTVNSWLLAHTGRGLGLLYIPVC